MSDPPMRPVDHADFWASNFVALIAIVAGFEAHPAVGIVAFASAAWCLTRACGFLPFEGDE